MSRGHSGYQVPVLYKGLGVCSWKSPLDPVPAFQLCLCAGPSSALGLSFPKGRWQMAEGFWGREGSQAPVSGVVQGKP